MLKNSKKSDKRSDINDGFEVVMDGLQQFSVFIEAADIPAYSRVRRVVYEM